jgi:hypothetical protein
MDNRFIIGEHVLIIDDCRDGGIATGQIGIYEGYFDPETGTQVTDWPGNPRIRLQDGSVIWGYECWWTPVRVAGPLPDEQRALEAHKTIWRAAIALLDD